jgi:hypothetical protein
LWAYLKFPFYSGQTAGVKSMSVFWVATPCGFVGRYRRFGGTYYLQLQGCLSILLTEKYFTNIEKVPTTSSKETIRNKKSGFSFCTYGLQME